jgi:hypothetical protein
MAALGKSARFDLGVSTAYLRSTMERLYDSLHVAFGPQRFDPSIVWAGNLEVGVGERWQSPVLTRVHLCDGGSEAIRIKAELYVAGVDPEEIALGVDARIWTDVNDRGELDERGVYHAGRGTYAPMRPAVDENGRVILDGNNVTFVSDPVEVAKTGVYHATVQFSADGKPYANLDKRWVSINDIAHNKDCQIVVSPASILDCPSIIEVCPRKVGAKTEMSRFVSGKIGHVTERLASMNADVVYLLPFFEAGFGDTHTGKDVRKGTLGSVYAVRDFFRIDPALVDDPARVDIEKLVTESLVDPFDLSDLLDSRAHDRVREPGDLLSFESRKVLVDWVGEPALRQIVGRAQLRALTRKAHSLGKRVIIDLVLKQTSRDCPLIEQHPDWYELDEEGVPRINQIAWLVYSDVALLDLPFNRPLQDYLSGVAPFWMRRCDFDGVRIDASQTIDRPFLKQIKNRINDVKADAIVLGETLCPLGDAIDVPVDMVYALLVDFHRDADRATPYIEFLEETYGAYPPGAVALAYFENHDSPRATRIWRERFDKRLGDDEALLAFWKRESGYASPSTVMACLKNLQASLIDATAGCAGLTNLAYGMEWGSDWGEEQQTDFENVTIIDDARVQDSPGCDLVRGYESLRTLVLDEEVLRTGQIYFHRHGFSGGEPEDRVLAYVRSKDGEGVIVVHNLDPRWTRQVTIDLARFLLLPVEPSVACVFDSYRGLMKTAGGSRSLEGTELTVVTHPLQSVVLKIACLTE